MESYQAQASQLKDGQHLQQSESAHVHESDQHTVEPEEQLGLQLFFDDQFFDIFIHRLPKLAEMVSRERDHSDHGLISLPTVK
ncbi:hypothetical protein [Paenibacillus massiliensis]|uniref:hypothetical protein n=1 Tax=Paenibacillus massiliensis TaxID=225917 RepID=UPI000375F0C0|nr:hypothetical protein [Paenibacillus massiliensis]